MIDKLEALAERHRELESLVADPALVKDPALYRDTMREHSRLSETMELYGAYRRVLSDLEGAKSLSKDEADPELRALAREEAHALEEKRESLEARLKDRLIPRDPLDDKNTIMEIRAGTGGDEAALFVADLYRMYSRFADARRWKIEVMSLNETELGGYKEIIFSISGESVYENRAGRAACTASSACPRPRLTGRIHTSAVTVAVLPRRRRRSGYPPPRICGGRHARGKDPAGSA